MVTTGIEEENHGHENLEMVSWEMQFEEEILRLTGKLF